MRSPGEFRLRSKERGIGEKVIVVAGTGAGADTAIVASASPSTKMTGLRVHEIICKSL